MPIRFKNSGRVVSLFVTQSNIIHFFNSLQVDPEDLDFSIQHAIHPADSHVYIRYPTWLHSIRLFYQCSFEQHE